MMEDDALDNTIKDLFKSVTASSGNNGMANMSSNVFSTREEAVKMSPFSKDYVAGENAEKPFKERILADDPDALKDLEDLIVKHIDMKMAKIIEKL
jgi:hypothetical protein